MRTHYGYGLVFIFHVVQSNVRSTLSRIVICVSTGWSAESEPQHVIATRVASVQRAANMFHSATRVASVLFTLFNISYNFSTRVASVLFPRFSTIPQTVIYIRFLNGYLFTISLSCR
jgi:hypothetical protein